MFPVSTLETACLPFPCILLRCDIRDAMKWYGDTWGCCADTDKTHALLVGSLDAAADARRHDSLWGTSSLAVVDQDRCLDI
jgi:hypothetical protein